MSEKVVPLKPAERNEESPLKVVDRDTCWHARYDVHPDRPVVHCRDCDADLDPFFVLRKIAGEHGSRFYLLDQLKKQYAKTEQQLKRSQSTRRAGSRAQQREAYAIGQAQKVQATDHADFKGDIREMVEGDL